MKITIQALLISTLYTLSATSFADSNKGVLQPWQPEVYDWIEDRFGKSQKKRAKQIYSMAEKYLHSTEEEKLNAVNQQFNSYDWISDQEHWDGLPDYWASPLETILTLGGDCEDLALAKFAMLQGLGVDPNKMMLTYVKIPERNNIAHMVLYYWHNVEKTGEPLVLDNMHKQVLPKSERKDLIEVYNIDGKHIRMSGREYSSKNQSNMRAVRIKYIADTMLLRRLNNDTPLMPYNFTLPLSPTSIKPAGQRHF